MKGMFSAEREKTIYRFCWPQLISDHIAPCWRPRSRYRAELVEYVRGLVLPMNHARDNDDVRMDDSCPQMYGCPPVMIMDFRHAFNAVFEHLQ